MSLLLDVALAVNSTLPSHFMLVSGTTSPKESCVVSVGSNVFLDACEDAVFALDGREVWSLGGNGQLVQGTESKCLGTSGEVKAGVALALLGCDSVGASGLWEFQGNGQIKLVSTDLCLSLSGSGAGYINVASKAAALASSTLDPVSHGASAVCDEDGASYWASKFDVLEPVNLKIDLGVLQTVASITIEFEHVAQSFSVYTSSDGQHWSETYATDTNVLKHVTIPGAGTLVSTVKLVLKKPHAIHGVLGSHGVYGIRSIAVWATQLHPVLKTCEKAALSTDAGDKYFAVAVDSFDPTILSKLRAELPALASADASLSATIAQLSDEISGSNSCQPKNKPSFLHSSQKRSFADASLQSWDEGRLASLFGEAKLTIIKARSSLH